MMMTTSNKPLNKAKNIGPKIEQRLNSIGVFSLADLAQITPVGAYNKMKEEYSEETLPVCYYLYSLQGALMDVHWDDLPKELKIKLKDNLS